VIFDYVDFNGATEYFNGVGRNRWDELEAVIDAVHPQLQPSDQRERLGSPIFDPKATNARLTESAASYGWDKVPVPSELRPFGLDWDGGKGPVLAEWQFSNYPFLWNNIIRTEAIYQSRAVLPQLGQPVEALIVVTKSGRFPASNSTLYFEQALAQINTVTTLGVFNIPIRLVGLTIDPNASELEVDWNQYPERYGRAIATTDHVVMNVAWSRRASMYGHYTAILS
jgi:hypothetical protein